MKLQRLALFGDLLDVPAAPSVDANAPLHSLLDAPPGVRWRPAHWVLIEDGRIVHIGTQAPGADWPRDERPGRLILPGFVDTHVHAPQLAVMASYGTELLDWLERYTFPAETAWADPAVAQAGAATFLDRLLQHGTTSGLVFPTVHKVSVDALFAAAQARGMRLLTGKCLMDRHAPEALRDDVASAERDTLDLLARWHGVDRLGYAHTVRFAPTSTEAQLALAGRLHAASPGSWVQTHVAENQAEVAWVRRLFPQARSYLDVYDRHGLLTPQATLAHGIWLDDDDRARLRDSGSVIAHCPTSNLFLGSGLFDWRAHVAAGGRLSIASDVGGGWSLSMHRTLAAAYQVAALRGQRLDAFTLLHAATAGNADSLQLGHEIGRLEVGHTADLCAWHWGHAGSLLAERLGRAHSLHEQLFAWLLMGDETLLDGVWVAGQPVPRRPVSRQPASQN